MVNGRTKAVERESSIIKARTRTRDEIEMGWGVEGGNSSLCVCVWGGAARASERGTWRQDNAGWGAK